MPKQAVPRKEEPVKHDSSTESETLGPMVVAPSFQLKASGVSQREEAGDGEELDQDSSLQGNVYNLKGELLGTLGKAGLEPIILYSREKLKVIRKAKRAAKKAGETFQLESTGWTPKDYCILPPLSHRKEMKKILKEDDTNGYTEYGGRGLISKDIETGKLNHDKKIHSRSKDGDPAGPEDSGASIRLDTFYDDREMEKVYDAIGANYEVDYTWHSHPGGSWKRKSAEFGEKENPWLTAEEFDKQDNKSSIEFGTTIGGVEYEEKVFDQGPSIPDLENARERYEKSTTPKKGGEEIYPLTRNFVIHKKEGWVYFYNQDTPMEKGACNVRIPLALFWRIE